MTNHQIRVCTDISPLIEGQVKNLSPLLSSYWHGLSKEEILAGNGNHRSDLVVTQDPDEAEFFALPMHWSYYLWNGRANMDQGIGLADLAARRNKQVIVWHKGDLAPILPFNNAILFAPGLNRSQVTAGQLACPVFVDDPMPLFVQGRQPYRSKSEKPSVGFCGFAKMGALKTIWSFVQGIRFNAESRLGLNGYSTESIVPATFLRTQALDQLAKCPEIEATFVIRDRYTGPFAESEAKQVFYSNIFDTDYTLCVRGNGNWSYRFYQTLACGRIPIFVDTDCVLPLSSHLDWKKYCVWIDRSNLKHIGEAVTDFHASLSQSDFRDLQMSCRALWQEHFTPAGFIKDLRHYLSYDAEPIDDRSQAIHLYS